MESWPTLGRPKEPLFASQAPISPAKTIKSDAAVISAAKLGTSLGGFVECSDEDSVDVAADDLEALYARPEFNESFGTSIAEALNKAAHSKNPRKQQIEASNGRTAPVAGKKKKNNKKTVLFSTGSHTFDGK